MRFLEFLFFSLLDFLEFLIAMVYLVRQVCHVVVWPVIHPQQAAVWIAEYCGWLDVIDDDLVSRYLRCFKPPWEVNFKDFFTSSWSGAPGQLCVEVAYKDGYVAVRDSKDPKKTTLVYTIEEWDAFIKGAKAGEFDFEDLRSQDQLTRR